ncbi:MAG: metallophosphoesterase, partial [Actinoplanes sp.]
MTEDTATGAAAWHRRMAALRRYAKATAVLAGRARRSRWTRRIRIAAAVALVSIGGAVVGAMLFAHADLNVGPFRAEMSISPSVRGGTEVDIPPLGSLHLDSHDGPLHLKVNLGSLDQNRTEALIDDPTAISSAGQNAVTDVREGVVRLGVRTLGIAVLSAMVFAALIFRNVRRVAAAGVTALALTAGSLGLAAGTLRPGSIAEPRYEGLLVNAPAVVGDARRIADNYGRY